MNNNILIRRALRDEINWVNQKYDEVKFKHSNFNQDIIVIAEIGTEKAGLGRLQKIDDDCAELGGMYVFPEFRRKGVADRIVEFLLTQARGYQRLVCLPFDYVSHFYRRFGFVEVELLSSQQPFEVPQKTREKHQWCNEFYPDKTHLFGLELGSKDQRL